MMVDIKSDLLLVDTCDPNTESVYSGVVLF
jgi:hypothetical protein